MHTHVKQWMVQAVTNTTGFKAYLQPFTRLFFDSSPSGTFAAKVHNIHDQNCEVFTVTLKPSAQWPSFKAGQHIALTIELNGRFLTRVFSISSSPCIHHSSGLIELTIQKQHKGKVTPHLSAIFKQQEKVTISEAKGNFTVDENFSQPLLMIAAGTGITPIRSLITELLTQRNHDIVLMYYAKNNAHLFSEEINYYQDKYPQFNAHMIDSTDQGRINLKHLEHCCKDFQSRMAYVCGPPTMIENTKTILMENGLSAGKIFDEYFGTVPVYDINVQQDGTVHFLQSNIHTENADNSSLLKIAESSGLKPNYGCRMGVCHQCLCKKKHGVVYNTITKKFSDHSAADIQLCISHAVGDVTLDL